MEVTARDLAKYRLELAEEKLDVDEFAPISEGTARTMVENASRLVEEIKGILAGQWVTLAGEGDTAKSFPEQ